MRGRAMRQLIGEVVAGNLDGRAATVAHQKLAAMRHADLAAGHERIFRLDPVDEAVCHADVLAFAGELVRNGAARIC